jgi:DNA-binding transcriptional MerR regulator
VGHVEREHGEPVDRRTVGEVARLTGVSVRTLHHYDDVGLLRPSERSTAGYRWYTDADLDRLRRVRYYRELEFSLDDIAALLDALDATAEDHLRRQHRLLREQIERRTELLVALEKEMEARQMGIALTPEEQFEVFGTDEAGGQWADEARERWGDSDAYRESARRTAAYAKADWIRIKADGDAELHELAGLLAACAPADGAAAMDLAERHRAHISRWFYDCGHDVHRGLAEMYVSDERFTRTFDVVAPGLAQYLHDAILANAARHGA